VLAATYSPLASTIGTTGLNFRVRNELKCEYFKHFRAGARLVRGGVAQIFSKKLCVTGCDFYIKNLTNFVDLLYYR
jgi:hypothetical protein